MTRLLVVDVGTSGVRTMIVDEAGSAVAEFAEPLPTAAPAPGLVEFDPTELLAVVDRLVAAAVATGPVTAVGIAVQRATTIAWDPTTGAPVGPAVGWQDLRTVGRCLELQGEGLRLAPNATATKAEWLLDHADPDRTRPTCVGTVDAYLAWHLTGEHVTDRSNASVTGLVEPGAAAWSAEVCDRLRIPVGSLPRIVDSAGVVGPVAAAGGAPLAGIAGDQQASLVGQGGLDAGATKITFGTGAMLDATVGTTPPGRSTHGTFPLVAWHVAGETTYLVEAVMLAAGTCVAWLVDGIGVVDSVDEVDHLAASVPTSEGVRFVPAMQGLGTPHWDHGARGALLGVTRGSTRAHVCRAVLEGVAHRAAELVTAAEADGVPIDRLRVDGGMTASPTFVQAVADATAELRRPAAIVEPTGDPHPDWSDAVDRAATWIPELSGLTF